MGIMEKNMEAAIVKWGICRVYIYYRVYICICE